MHKHVLSSLVFAGTLLAVGPASASIISYNTSGSVLSCNGVSGCVQATSTTVQIGGLVFTYNSGSGTNVATPSIINLGNVVATGTSNGISVAGLLLSINFNLAGFGSGTLPNGVFTGSMSTNSSGASLGFSPNNTTSPFGTLPGVSFSGGSSYVVQVLNPLLGLQAPTVGNPVGQTSIQGAITDTTPRAVPEPASVALMGVGLIGFVASRRRRKQPDAAGIGLAGSCMAL